MSEIKERPILFTGEMVRAILDERKTQTRRPVKPQPPKDHGKILGPEMYSPLVYGRNGEEKPGKEVFGIYDDTGEWGAKCPYGKVGDHLWVRETWAECKHVTINGSPTALYKSTYIQPSKFPEFTPKWRPSIFMPRWASRIDLEITGLRAERIQNITEEDAIAEGIEQKEPNNVVSAKYRFAQLWDSINAKRGFGWDKNPLVWVIEFKII